MESVGEDEEGGIFTGMKMLSSLTSQVSGSTLQLSNTNWFASDM
jgi:hypothetical protein